jgi:type I restriction enzyme R subunit
MDEREDIAAYIKTLQVGAGLNEKEIKDGYEQFKEEKLK